jgi:hypothetical protein
VEWDPQTHHGLRAPGFFIQVTQTSSCDTVLDSQCMLAQSSAEAVASHLSTLLSHTTGFCTSSIEFDPTIPMNFGMITDSFFHPEPVAYRYIADRLLLNNFLDGESPEEFTPYEHLPSGAYFIANYQGRDCPCSQIWVHASLCPQLGLPAQQHCFDIKVNSNWTWHYDYMLGPLPLTVDFRHSFAHEILHGLGFLSITRPIASPIPQCESFSQFLMDIFRVTNPGPGAGMSGAAFSAWPRETTECPLTDPFFNPVLVTRLDDPNWLYRLSTGETSDRFDSSHWKHSAINNNQCIGLMDPVLVQCPVLSYLQASDLRALDILGWVIELDTVPLPPSAMILDQPANAFATRSASPTFSWGTGSGAYWSHFSLFQSAPNGSRTIVYRSTFIPVTGPTDSLQIPSGILQPGETYEWSVTAENDVGVNYADIRTIVILCPADYNESGEVTVQDIYDFLAAWSAMSISADFNMSGEVTVQDIYDFLAQWQSGC